MGKRGIQVGAKGQQYRFGRTDTYGAVWRKGLFGWREVGRYPLNPEGWQAAHQAFEQWEREGAGSHPLLGRPLVWMPVGALVIAAAVLTPILLTGGSSSSHLASTGAPAAVATSLPPASAGAVGSGYLASGSTYIYFLQWTIDRSGSFSGSLQSVVVKDSPPSATTAGDTTPVTGTVNGSNISMQSGFGTQTYGTTGHDAFTLNIPQPDGSLLPLTFHQASAAAFNEAVSSLKARVAAADEAEQQSETEQAEEQQIVKDASAIASDVVSLQDLSSLNQAVGSVDSALQQEATDLAKTKADEQKVLAEARTANSSTTCYDATNVVGYDATNDVGYDANNDVGYAANNDVEYVAGQIRGQLSATNAAVAQLQSDEQQLPSYQAPNLPDPGTVKAAEEQATSALAAAIAQTNKDIDQANADVASAIQYADTAIQAGNCGSALSQPAAVGHIS